MAAPTNAIAAVLTLARSKTGYSTKDATLSRTMTDLAEFAYIEQTVVAGATAVAVNFGPVATADFVLIYSPQDIAVHINGAAEEQIKVGSIFLVMDTAITSIHIDNDVEAVAADAEIEIWLGTTTT